MSLTSLLSIARSALQTHERAVAVIGHNIANAETPGYTRQRLELAAVAPERTPLGQLGRGVQALGVERLRSSFYDGSWRRETGVEERYRALARNLEQAGAVLDELGDSGLGGTLDRLLDAFHALSANPTDPTQRAVVVGTAAELVDKFRVTDARLTSLVQGIGADLRAAAGDANAILAEVNELNGLIRASNGQAVDLADRRDLLIDRLSGMLDVQVLDRGQGTVDVVAGGVQLVSAGGGVQPLSIGGQGPYQLQFGNPPVAVTAGQGSIRGLIDAAAAIGARGTATVRATGLRGQLDDFALSLVSAVNQIHSDYDPTTKPLQPTLTPPPAPLRTVGAFFDPNGVTAATIDIDAAIKADPTQIAGGYSTAAGDNTIILRLAGLRTLAVPVPGGTGATPSSPAVTPGQPVILGEYFGGVVSALGIATRDAQSRATSQGAFVQHLAAQRQDQQGVSIDEEMVRLIEHQQAYTAAARLVQMADEMLRELINLGR